MIVPLVIILVAVNLVQAKQFLVETEHNKDNLDEEDRLLEQMEQMLTEKQVSEFIKAFPHPQNAELIYKSMNKSAKQAIRKKLHQAYGDDKDAVRSPLVL